MTKEFILSKSSDIVYKLLDFVLCVCVCVCFGPDHYNCSSQLYTLIKKKKKK